MGLVVCVWVCRQCLGSLVVGWWFSVMVFSGSVGDGGSRRWWGFCLGLPAVMGFVFGFAGSDGVSGFDFSPSSRPWLQTKWVVVGLGLPAWVWWLWVWVCRRGCGGYGRLLLIGCRGFGWGVKKNI
uniref:Transmembrane protein n=1 Tax=Fagus sylvatica TaxID=28930 RepID=A0A2N9HEA1_FAGSY